MKIQLEFSRKALKGESKVKSKSSEFMCMNIEKSEILYTLKAEYPENTLFFVATKVLCAFIAKSSTSYIYK